MKIMLEWFFSDSVSFKGIEHGLVGHSHER